MDDAASGVAAAQLRAGLFEDADELASHEASWDELAVRSSRPFSAPAWVMGWWRHLRPDGARLRVVLVWAGEALVGVVPLYAAGRTLRPIGDGMPAAEPLAAPARERDVAERAAALLAAAEPHPRRIELELGSAAWVAVLTAAWPGRRRPYGWRRGEIAVPRVEMRGGFDSWFASKGKSFRRDIRRNARRVEDAAGDFRLATVATLPADVETFLRLHRGRLAGQGGTNLEGEGVEGMLVDAGSALIEAGRFELFVLECDGAPVAVEIVLSAGRETVAWNGGFDEAFARLSPSMQCLIRVLSTASERGREEVSLGPGDQAYKYRLANRDDALRSYVLIPPGRGFLGARLRLALEQLRRAVGRRLPAGLRSRLRS
jgi:CelD/BcsL family acetyltransferase involved in cellulose biosynthesis